MRTKGEMGHHKTASGLSGAKAEQSGEIPHSLTPLAMAATTYGFGDWTLTHIRPSGSWLIAAYSVAPPEPNYRVCGAAE